MFIRIMLILTCAWALVGLLAAEAESAVGSDAVEVGSSSDEAVAALDRVVKAIGYSYVPRDDRRDPFFDLILVKRKEAEALALSQKNTNADVGETVENDTQDVMVPTSDSGVYEAERFARQVIDEVRRKFLEQKWKSLITHCDKRLRELKDYGETYPDSATIKDAIQRVRNAKVQAEEKYRYEVAKAEFDALDIKIEGVIWSADQQSLAIINNEPIARGVNDKVRNDAAVIVSIDQNRVDFMVVQDANTFHFQRYIGD